MKKNILIFIPKFSIGGGIESWLNNFIKHFNEEFNITILTLFTSNNLLNKSCRHISLNEPQNKTNIFNRIRLIICRVYTINKIVSNDKIDFIITGGNIPNLMGSIYKMFYKKTYIINSIHNSFFIQNNFEKLILILSKKVNKIVFVSKEAENIAKLKFNLQNSCTIYNFTSDTQYIYKNNKSVGEIKFLIVGRLDKNKNHEFIINCFNELYKKGYINIELDIIGTGNLSEYLKSYTSNLESSMNIKFLGQKNNIEQIISKYSYLLMASKYEGFPTVFIEAIKNGLPIITTDFKTGAKEIIRNNNITKDCTKVEVGINGILTPQDMNSYIDGLEKGIQNKFNKNNIINYYINNFDNNLIKSKWIYILNNNYDNKI